MRNRRILRSGGLTTLAVTLGLVVVFDADAASRSPNVVLILTDDLGWRDLGCYGSKYHQTPNIDRLASEGLLFRQAYSASPLCSPTRASIMTGLHPARLGITAPVCHLPNVNFKKELQGGGNQWPSLAARSVTRLSTDYYTLAEAFHAAGYRIAHFGKWHLGREPYSPLQQGFDMDTPHMAGPGPGGSNGYFAPWAWWPGVGRQGEHIDDRLATEAAAFLREGRDRPFFLNLWLFGVHAPWMGKADYVDEAARRADPDSPQRHPVYAAMIRSTDEAVGKVLDSLDEHGLAENTLVIFASDNGAWHNVAREATSDPRYAEIPVTSNAPLRSGKASLYEGGTRTPLIIRWPGVTEAGAVTDALWQSTDIFPTLVDACGLPREKCPKWDGVSQADFIRGAEPPRDTVFCHFPHSGRGDIEGFAAGSYVRRGNWKLCRFFAAGPEQRDRLELYDLANDIGETRDVSPFHPRVVEELNALINEYLTDTEAVVPTRNPNFGRDRVTINGWSAHRDARVEKEDTGALRIQITGNDPILLPPQAATEATGPVKGSVFMRTTCSGPAEVFWGTKPGQFDSSRRVTFEVKSDGRDRRYEFELPADRLKVIRFDPATGTGEIVVHAFEVRDQRGEAVIAWPR